MMSRAVVFATLLLFSQITMPSVSGTSYFCKMVDCHKSKAVFTGTVLAAAKAVPSSLAESIFPETDAVGKANFGVELGLA
ncbi:unnamed protein product [Phyllotreta striolata]|uniref:Uncharacterized protein n=1 Tax=Phyllotreta striolata TaxID=444603 RepID=A0A9N9TF62_PHYSR|nr:unnamed protein product [Phyllotreta striolata]